MAASPDAAWRALLDVETVSKCFPGVEQVRQTAPDRYSGVVRVRLGPISAAFELTGAVEADEAARAYRVAVTGRERLTGTVVRGAFAARVGAADVATPVAYELDVTLLGRLGQLSQAVFRDVAGQLTAQAISCLQRQLADSVGKPTG